MNGQKDILKQELSLKKENCIKKYGDILGPKIFNYMNAIGTTLGEIKILNGEIKEDSDRRRISTIKSLEIRQNPGTLKNAREDLNKEDQENIINRGGSIFKIVSKNINEIIKEIGEIQGNLEGNEVSTHINTLTQHIQNIIIMSKLLLLEDLKRNQKEKTIFQAGDHIISLQ